MLVLHYNSKVFMKKKGRTVATRAVYSRIPRDNSEELTMFRNEDSPIGMYNIL